MDSACSCYSSNERHQKSQVQLQIPHGGVPQQKLMMWKEIRTVTGDSYTASSSDNTLLDTLKFFAAFDHQNNEVSVYPAYLGKNEVRSSLSKKDQGS